MHDFSTFGQIVTPFPQDVKQAVPSLFRTTALSITVVLTLALGLGANAAIFGLVRGVLPRPLDHNYLASTLVGMSNRAQVEMNARAMG